MICVRNWYYTIRPTSIVKPYRDKPIPILSQYIHISQQWILQKLVQEKFYLVQYQIEIWWNSIRILKLQYPRSIQIGQQESMQFEKSCFGKGIHPTKPFDLFPTCSQSFHIIRYFLLIHVQIYYEHPRNIDTTNSKEKSSTFIHSYLLELLIIGCMEISETMQTQQTCTSKISARVFRLKTYSLPVRG